jgi:O-antigen/teichoic acid export membrane protein
MKTRLERAQRLLAASANGTTSTSFATGSAAAFLVYAVGHGLAFSTQLLIAHLIGASSYGMYAYVFAWMSVLAYTAMLGFNISLLRLIPTYAAISAWPLLAGLVRYADRRVIAASLLLAAIGAALVMTAQSILEVELRNAFVIGFLLVPLLSLVSVRAAAVRAYGGVVSALVPIRIIREGFLFTFVCSLWFLRTSQTGADVVMMATVLGSLFALVVASRSLHRLQPRAVRIAKPAYDTRAWWQAAVPLLIITAVESLFDKTGVLILGLAGAHQEAGIFALIFNMSMLVVLPRTAIDTVFAPTIARLYAEEKHAEVQRLIIRASLLSLGGAGCVVAGLTSLAGPILLWFGPEFAGGTTPLNILLIGQLVAAASGSQLSVLAMTGNESRAASILALSAVANALTCAALVSFFGLIGAAVATAAAFVAWNVLMALDIWRKLQIWPGVIGLFRPAAV